MQTTAAARTRVLEMVASGEARERREKDGPRSVVARRFGVDPMTLYRWETGRHLPTSGSAAFRRYARYLLKDAS